MQLKALRDEAEELFERGVTEATCMARDAAEAGRMVAVRANKNRKSGGTHFIEDDVEDDVGLGGEKERA